MEACNYARYATAIQGKGLLLQRSREAIKSSDIILSETKKVYTFATWVHNFVSF